MYPTKDYQKTFETIEKSILSCNKLEQIETINNMISIFIKDCALPVHYEHLNELLDTQVKVITSIKPKRKKTTK